MASKKHRKRIKRGYMDRHKKALFEGLESSFLSSFPKGGVSDWKISIEKGLKMHPLKDDVKVNYNPNTELIEGSYTKQTTPYVWDFDELNNEETI